MILLISAFVLAAISLPLIFRVVPMNRLYGVRFPQAFKSVVHWERINQTGGIALLVSSLPIAVMGIVWMMADPLSDSLQTAGVIVALVSPILACAYSYFRARRIDRSLTTH